MSSTTAIRTRLTTCSVCGHRGRLVIATETEVISRCHVCGDEQRSTPVPVVGRVVERAPRPRGPGLGGPLAR